MLVSVYQHAMQPIGSSQLSSSGLVLPQYLVLQKVPPFFQVEDQMSASSERTCDFGWASLYNGVPSACWTLTIMADKLQLPNLTHDSYGLLGPAGRRVDYASLSTAVLRSRRLEKGWLLSVGLADANY